MVFSLEESLVQPVDPKSLEIFKSFDISKSNSENIAALKEEYGRIDLEAAVAYIKDTYKETHPIIVQKIISRKSRTKEMFVIDIKIFLRGIETTKCAKCDEDYCHTKVDNTTDNNINCLVCKRFCHYECHKELTLDPGIFFVCTQCLNKLNLNRQQEKNEAQDDVMNTSHISTHSFEDIRSHPVDEATGGAPNTQQQQDKPAEKKNTLNSDTEEARDVSETRICQLYMQYKCPHGLKGENCEFEHPKRCRKYCSHGTDRYNGCRRGRNCWFYHPKLCQNSVRVKLCLNHQCSLTHLAGTRRKNPPREEENRSYTIPEARPSQTPPPPPWSQSSQAPLPPWSQPVRQEEKKSEEKFDFLGFMKEFKIDLQNQITQAIQPIQSQQQQLYQYVQATRV